MGQRFLESELEVEIETCYKIPKILKKYLIWKI